MFEAVKSHYRKLAPHITDGDLNALEQCLAVLQICKGDFLMRVGQDANTFRLLIPALLDFFTPLMVRIFPLSCWHR